MVFELSEYTDKYVMHCDTREKAILFTTYLHNHGKRWINGDSYLNNENWAMHKPDTCYRFVIGRAAGLKFYQDHGLRILEFDHFDWNAYTGEDIDEHAFDDMLKAM